MKPATLFKLAAALLVLSAVGLAASSWSMKDRLSQRDNPMVYFQEPIPFESFLFRDEPVTLTLVDDPAEYPAPQTADDIETETDTDTAPADRLTDANPDDPMALRIDFRGQSVYFPLRNETDRNNYPQAPENERLTLIAGWFKILQFVDGVSSIDEIKPRLDDGTLKTRLVVAARYQPPGLKPTWAAVQRQNWLYRFAELKPEGDTPITLTERTYRELDAIGTPGTRTDPELIPATPEERAGKLWMHYTMQQVTPPKFFRAKDRDLDLALDAMGWTWPAALASGFGIVTAIVLIGFAAKGRVA